MNSESILDSTKKVLGIDSTYTVFDQDIIMHINSAFSTLNQLGVGPSAGFAIEGRSETWATFLGVNPLLSSVKSYVYMKVRLMFDPPSTSFAITSFQEQINQLEWRLQVAADPPVGLTSEGRPYVK